MRTLHLFTVYHGTVNIIIIGTTRVVHHLCYPCFVLCAIIFNVSAKQVNLCADRSFEAFFSYPFSDCNLLLKYFEFLLSSLSHSFMVTSVSTLDITSVRARTGLHVLTCYTMVVSLIHLLLVWSVPDQTHEVSM